jgi:hypothetical protein
MTIKANVVLAGTTAIALLTSVSFATAQSSGGHQGGSSGATQAAPGGGSQGGMGAGSSGAGGNAAPAERMESPRSGGGHSGGMSHDRASEMKHNQRTGGSGPQGSDRQRENTGQTERSGETQHNERMGHDGDRMGHGANERNERSGRTDQNERNGRAAEHNGSTAERNGQNTRHGARENTGSAPSKVTTEQRTEIRSKLSSHSSGARLKRSDVHFSLSVGTRVPRSVHVLDLPSDIVEIVPAYRGYKYVLVGDEIVIIDPATFEIVAVIT